MSRIEQAAQERLRKSSHSVLHSISCSFERGSLILLGQVPSFYYKQLAQEAVVHLEGVTRIVNDIEVVG